MHVSHITNWSTYNWLFPSDFWPFTNITNELKEKGQKPTLHWTMGPPLTSWKLPLALVKGNRGSMKSYDCQKLHDVSHTGNDLISLKIAQITNYSKSSPIIALRRIWPNCIRPRILHINRCFPWKHFNSTSQDLILSIIKIPPLFNLGSKSLVVVGLDKAIDLFRRLRASDHPSDWEWPFHV